MPKYLGNSNRLLTQLTPSVRDSLIKLGDWSPLEFKELLAEQGKPIKHVYFPTSGVISLVSVVHGEKVDTVESGTIGREGLMGVPAILGARQAPTSAIVQVPGHALRIEAKKFLAALRKNDDLRDLLLLYTNALMAMVAQSAACNRAHEVVARMARWLLMTHDRVDGDDFPLTQEFLGQMLGVRRPAVNIAGRQLQADGYIQYTRGRIRILDRKSLEEVSCGCYAFVERIMATVRLR
jgi:CRP-like cAMP-binding protein